MSIDVCERPGRSVRPVAILAGDGIGPEIAAQAVKVLKALDDPMLGLSIREAPVGASAYLLTGQPLPPSTLSLVQDSHAVLFGAVGDPRFDNLERDLRPEASILQLRHQMGLFAALKRVTVEPSLAGLSPLRPDLASGIDILIVRELSGDVYTGTPRGVRKAVDGDFVGDREGFDTMRYAEGEVRRVARIAFESARQRSGRVCSVDKSNVLETSRVWRNTVIEVARSFPDVRLEHMYADNAVMQLISRPRQFDVVLTGNLFGDILSDAASVLTGSIGLPASALLGDGPKGLFEAGHGTALDIAGRDKANPIACIRAAALMLRHSFGRADLAACVESAVATALVQGYRTPEIHSPGMKLVGTDAMGDAVVKALQAAPGQISTTSNDSESLSR